MTPEEELANWPEGTGRYKVFHCQHVFEPYCEGFLRCKLCEVIKNG